MADNSIYNEAILDAKKLREVAEANARNALIEAVTPRVRELIEKQLLNDTGDIDSSVSSINESKGEEDIILDLDLLQGGAEGGHDPGVEDDDELLLSTESVEALMALKANESVDSVDELIQRVSRLKRGLNFAKDLSESSASDDKEGRVLLARLLTKMVTETKTLKNEVICIESRDSASSLTSLSESIKKVLKEIVEMASRKQLINENAEMFEVDLSEFDLSEEEDFDLDDDESLDVDGEDDEEMDMDDDEVDLDMDDDDDSIEVEDITLPGDLAQELLAALEDAVGEDSDMDDDEIDLEMEDEVDVEDDEAMDMDDDDEVVEIDEGMLRRELARMKRSLDESDGIEDFGGGKVDKEVFVDGDDSDLNVHSESRRMKSKLQKESRKNRALRKQLKGHQRVTAKLQEQLEQMNLFNAKLLYVNKLMNKSSITTRQKKQVVEALDKAQTLREVRLLFKTLSESLSKGRRKKPLSESRHRGSSSRSVGNGGSTNKTQNSQTDRWAKLAGINSNSK
jgi:hypothetical protein